tara:strand:- start:22833 stop:24272 length:1440 start_codon:yes stop_codon:yes gene_type:complete
MINKFKKLIFTKVNIESYKHLLILKKFINSVSFLKYIILIFLVFFSIYLLVPKFFYTSKRIDLVKNLLIDKYNINLNEYSTLNYTIFPSPKLTVKNYSIKSNLLFLSGKGENLNIYLKINNLINFKKLKTTKISLDNSKIFIESKNLQSAISYVVNLKDKINIRNSNITILDNNISIIDVSNFYFNNKNIDNLKFEGLVFNKKTKIKFLRKKEFNKLVLSIPSIDSKTKVILKKNSTFKNFQGYLKSNILSNKITLEFNKEDKIEISNSFLSNKILNSAIKGIVQIKPFFNFDLIFNIRNITSSKSFLKSYLTNALEFVKTNKNLNGKLKIIYGDTKYQSKFIDNGVANINLENGELNIENLLLNFNNGKVSLSGIFTEINEYQMFEFNTKINFFDKQKLAKSLGIKKNQKKEKLEIKVSGEINLLSNKINFKKIFLNEREIKSTKIYKKYFEKVLIKDGLVGIFNTKNIKNFAQIIFQ